MVDHLISSVIKERFNQPAFRVYANLETLLLLKAANGEDTCKEVYDLASEFNGDVNVTALVAQLSTFQVLMRGVPFFQDILREVQDLQTVERQHYWSTTLLLFASWLTSILRQMQKGRGPSQQPDESGRGCDQECAKHVSTILRFWTHIKIDLISFVQFLLQIYLYTWTKIVKEISANLLLLTAAIERVVFPCCYFTCFVPGNWLQPIKLFFSLSILTIQLVNKN